MGRALIGALVAAVIAAAIGYHWWAGQQTLLAKQAQVNRNLTQEISRLRDTNSQLRAHLAKVQQEEDQLAAQNNALNEAIAKARLTGKVPPKLALPYPPK